MNRKQIYVGMMSGTSLDGVDAVASHFGEAGDLKVLGRSSVDFPPQLRALLLKLASSDLVSFSDLSTAEELLTRSYAHCWKLLSQQHPSITPLALGCHGQTIEHRPNKGYTLQLLNPSLLAELTGCNVVCDFRRRDLAAGGQGAPLAPAFHQGFMASNTEDRIIINLGGIANITWLPAQANQPSLGMDTGPANILLDSWCQLKQRQAFDDQGHWARSGQRIPELLTHLLKDSYFTQGFPKSTGREKFNLNWLQDQLTEFSSSHLADEDIQATLTELTVVSLCQAINTLDVQGAAKLLVCGGGAKNLYLLERIAAVSQRATLTTDELGIPSQDVEALAFAWLAYRHQQGLSGNLPKVTGAKGERILGGYYPA